MTWTLRTSSRRPTSVLTGPAYIAAPVSMSVMTSAAVTQCTMRSVRSKRTIAARIRSRLGTVDGRSRRLVVAAVGAADPRVDVVAALLPVAGHDVRRVSSMPPSHLIDL